MRSSRVAVEQGKLAGIYVAHNLGLLDESSAEKLAKPIQRKLKRLQAFQSAVSDLYSVRPGIFSLPSADTIICRCEEISFGDIRKAIRTGNLHLDDIKRITRAGMGYCQGRACASAILGIVEHELGSKPESAGFGSARPPIKPIPMSILLESGPSPTEGSQDS